MAGDKVWVLVANLTNADRQITIETGALRDATVSYLDEANYHESVTRPDLLRTVSEPITAEANRVTLGLAPYAIAVINGERG